MAQVSFWKDGFKGTSLNKKAVIQAVEGSEKRKRFEKYVREEELSIQANQVDSGTTN